MKQISDKQAKEKARQRKLRKQLIMEGPHDSAGFPLCVKCKGRGDYRGLALIHLKRLSDGGRTSKKNCRIWCYPCHNGDGKGGHKTEVKRNDKPVDRPCELSGHHGLRPYSKSEQVGSKK